MSQEQFKNAILSYTNISRLIDDLHGQYQKTNNAILSEDQLEHFYNQKEKLSIRFHQCILEDTLTKDQMKDIAYRLVWIFSKKYASILDEEKAVSH